MALFSSQRSWKRLAAPALLLSCGGQTDDDLFVPPFQIGEICVPADENSPRFSGFALNETLVESEDPAWDTDVCVVRSFQGRVTCPYGQTSGETHCLTSLDAAPITVPVAPQLLSRPPQLASIRSCPCAGPGPGPFCACPSDMQCSEVLFSPLFAFPSYCVPRTSQAALEAECDRALANCEDRVISGNRQ